MIWENEKLCRNMTPSIYGSKNISHMPRHYCGVPKHSFSKADYWIKE
jgi:hypothetical protein